MTTEKLTNRSSKMSRSVVLTSSGAPSQNGAKNSESNRSSPGYVGTSRSGNFAKISASVRRRAACTARRFSASAAWFRWIQSRARRWAAVSGSSRLTRDSASAIPRNLRTAEPPARGSAIRVARELRGSGVAGREHLGHARQEGHQDRRHQRAEVLGVEVLVDRREGVLLEEKAAREDSQRLPGRAAAVARDGPRARRRSAGRGSTAASRSRRPRGRRSSRSSKPDARNSSRRTAISPPHAKRRSSPGTTGRKAPERAARRRPRTRARRTSGSRRRSR